MSETTTTGAPQRPTFLTVLRILSFIGCGLGIFGGITGYFTYKALVGSGDALSSEISNSMDEAIASGEMSDAEREMPNALGDALGCSMDFGAMATSSLVQGLTARSDLGTKSLYSF